MKQNKKLWIFGILAIVALATVYATPDLPFVRKPSENIGSQARQDLLPSSSGKVTMIDLGATECIPCKMMAPIIEELKREYGQRADIIFVDVWKHPEQAKKYGIRAIPTQIFFDASGREVYRNTGFMDRKRIVEILTRLGVS